LLNMPLISRTLLCMDCLSNSLFKSQLPMNIWLRYCQIIWASRFLSLWRNVSEWDLVGPDVNSPTINLQR
jgi:hypothetical protein